MIAGLKYSYHYSDYFSRDDPELLFYDSAMAQFTKYEDLLILGVEHDKNVFDTTFLKKLRDFEDILNQVKGVKATSSVVTTKNYVNSLTGIKEELFVSIDFLNLRKDTSLFFQYPDVYPKFVSPDRKSVCVYLFLDEKPPENFIANLKKVLSGENFQNHYIYGYRIAEEQFEEQLQMEVITLSLVSLILIIAFVYLFYRTMIPVLIAIIFIGVTVLISLGFLKLIGADLNLLTVIIPSVVAIIAMSDLIHVISRLHEERGRLLEQAIIRTYNDLRLSLLLTSVTTAFGFLSLTFTGVRPFVHFGLTSAFGILCAYLLTIFFLPELLRLFYSSPQLSQSLSRNLLSGIDQLISKRNRLIAAVFVMFFAVFIVFARQNEVNAYIYDDLDSSDPMSEALHFFEENFFGIRDINLFISIDPKNSIYDREVLIQLESIEHYLMEEYGARSVYGFATLVKRYNRMYYSGVPERFVIPREKIIQDRLVSAFDQFEPKSVLYEVITPDHRYTQIMVKSMDWGSKVSNEKLEKLNAFLTQHIDKDLMTIKISGESLFLDKSNENIARNLFFSLIGAFVIVFMVVLALYRNFRIALIALLVNIFPLVALLTVMYFSGIYLNKSTVMVFTIAFGIAVDDTLHFLGRLKTELNNGEPLHKALNNVLVSTGEAIGITSVILIAGFVSLIFSSFQSTTTTGTLISLALFFALIADVIFLPALIRFSKLK